MISLSAVQVRDCLGGLKNHKDACCNGTDAIPADLLKYSSSTVVQVLTHLFHSSQASAGCPNYTIISKTFLTASGNHSASIRLRVAEAEHCSNYSPLVLRPIVDKMFANLLLERVAGTVRLNVHQDRCLPPWKGNAVPIRRRTCQRSCGAAPQRYQG